MSQHEIETQWMGKMQFNALINGHTIVMDAPETSGGEDNGPIPKPFILTALSGCTGMDIVALLRKSHQEVSDLSIRVIGVLSVQKPITYTSMHLVYDFKGDEANKSAALDAVNLSQTKYCGVSALLKKALAVSWEVNYNGVSVFNNREVVEDAAVK